MNKTNTQVSNGSVCSVRNKYGASEISFGTAKAVPKLNSKKELYYAT